MIEELLKQIPDKCEYMATTSHRFKQDVWEFCQELTFKELDVVELGTSNGYSTLLLSHLFNSVTTINNNESLRAKDFNKDRNNITFYNFDLYNGKWPITHGDVFFIDADHSYSGVRMDVQNSLAMQSRLEKKLFIFDDYGVLQYEKTVRAAIDEFVEDGVLEIVGYVGCNPGHSFDGSPDRTLTHYEGIICQEL